MKLTIVTPHKALFEDEASLIVLPGEDGEFSVMDFHISCLYSLRAGQITVRRKRNENNIEKKFVIKRGVARVEGNSLTVMAEEL